MVIQRWQSLLLFIAAVVMASFTFLSLGQITTENYTFNFTSLGFFQEGELAEGIKPIIIRTWYFFIVSLTTIVILLLDIFLFSNLRLQKTVCLISILMIIADASICGFEGFCGIEGGQIGWSSNILCPFIAILATAMAYWRMNSDHNKLRNADRLR